MHKTALVLLLPLTLGLAACNSGSNSGSSSNDQATASSSQAVPQKTAVSGTVSLQPDAALNYPVAETAKLQITLSDISQQPNLTIGQKTIEPVGKLPVQFNVDFDANLINPSDVIVLVATITDGERIYNMPLQQAVVNNGKFDGLDIVLVPEPTAGEEMLVEYETALAQLGGMKITKGTSRNDDGSRAWQVFSKNGHVQFIRDINDNYDSGARIKTDYAYKDGKPWIVVRNHLPSADAEPTSVEKAGWNADGELVLNMVTANGQTEKISAQEASALQSDAAKRLKEASSK